MMNACCERLRDAECMARLGEKRNRVAAILSGTFFFVGWWIFIGVVSTPSDNWLNAWCVIVGVAGTVSMFMINTVSNAQVQGEGMGDDGFLGTKGARLWLLTGFILGFCALIAAVWILFQEYVVQGFGSWPGVALVAQNVLIFLASLTYKFGRSEEQWGI